MRQHHAPFAAVVDTCCKYPNRGGLENACTRTHFDGYEVDPESLDEQENIPIVRPTHPHPRPHPHAHIKHGPVGELDRRRG